MGLDGTSNAVYTGMTKHRTAQIVLVVEYSSTDYDARTKNTRRLMAVSTTLDGQINVTIKAEAAIGNCDFITLSDAIMPLVAYKSHVEPGICKLPGAVVRVGQMPL